MLKKMTLVLSLLAFVSFGCTSDEEKKLAQEKKLLFGAAGPIFEKLPQIQLPKEIVELEPGKTTQQNWNYGQREWYWHVPQGTAVMPYDWFMALEQPKIFNLKRRLFSDPNYLIRFGFLPDNEKSKHNPGACPLVLPRTANTTTQIRGRPPPLWSVSPVRPAIRAS